MPTQDLNVGDVVAFRMGATTFHARVIENRGHLGVGGRQIVRIEVIELDPPPEESWRFEMPVDRLDVVQRAA